MTGLTNRTSNHGSCIQFETFHVHTNVHYVNGRSRASARARKNLNHASIALVCEPPMDQYFDSVYDFIAIHLYTHWAHNVSDIIQNVFCLHKRQPHCPHLNLVFERKKRAVRQILSVFSVIWLCPLVLNVPRWQHDSEECVRDKERRSSSFAAQYSVCKLFEHMSQAILTIFELYARTSQLNRRAIEKR